MRILESLVESIIRSQGVASTQISSSSSFSLVSLSEVLISSSYYFLLSGSLIEFICYLVFEPIHGIESLGGGKHMPVTYLSRFLPLFERTSIFVTIYNPWRTDKTKHFPRKVPAKTIVPSGENLTHVTISPTSQR